MKTLNQINEQLKKFETEFNLPIVDAKQGSDAWFNLKLGVVSASNAHKVVAKKDSDTRATYMAELIAQVCTGDQEEINSKYLDWGNQYEAAARSCYEFSTGETITQVPFVFKDGLYREGCSPDGIVSDKKGVEIKCPYNAVHYVKFLTEDKIKSEYAWQCQYQLRVMQADSFDFVQYHPNMQVSPIKVLTIQRDEEKQKAFDDLVPAFVEDMDKILSKIGLKHGDQWKRLSNSKLQAVV